MKIFITILCIILSLTVSIPVHASDEEEIDREDYSSYPIPHMERKSVATAALLSAIPGFGAGLYYAEEYPMAISCTIGMAMGLGLFLDAQLRTHRSSEKISAITVMGTSWLLGVIYAPISVHQRNKVIDETYGLTPYLDVSHKKLYAGVGIRF